MDLRLLLAYVQLRKRKWTNRLGPAKQQGIRDCNAHIFTETCLNHDISEQAAARNSVDRVHEYSWKKRCGICVHIVDTCSSHTVTSLCTVITCCLTLNVKMPTNVNVAILSLLFTIYNAIYGMTERFCSRSLRQIFLHVTYHSLVLFPQLLHNRCLVSSSQWKEGCTLSL